MNLPETQLAIACYELERELREFPSVDETAAR